MDMRAKQDSKHILTLNHHHLSAIIIKMKYLFELLNL